MKLYNGDCLELMKEIPDGSVDMILADLPYGITHAPFDIRLPFKPLWKEFYRVTKKNAAMALFANGKFLIELAASNLKHYRYKWVWKKPSGSGYFNSKKMPLKAHEDILIFYQQLPTYNPQWFYHRPYKATHRLSKESINYGTGNQDVVSESKDGKRYPIDVVHFNYVNHHHPTPHDQCKLQHLQQKPVDLLEYLIRTYTDEGETVLDATMGSGSTGVAAINTGRKFIGFELDEKYFEIAERRIEEALAKKRQELF